MARFTHSRGIGNWILAMPSFWGFAGFSLALGFYFIVPIGWQTPHVAGVATLVLMLIAYGLSVLLLGPLFRSQFRISFASITTGISPLLTVLLHLIGLFAALLFVMDLESSGLLDDGVVYLLLNDPLAIRGVALDTLTRGVFLGYIGWIAIFFSAILVARSRRWRSLLICLVLLQIASNLVFLNKIRPVVAMLLFVLPYLIVGRRLSGLQLLLSGLALAAAVAGFFVYWSASTGKVFALGIGYNPAVETLLLYLTSGPAYLDHILDIEEPEMTLRRILRPVYIFGTIVFGTDAPPSGINPFYSLPITTNVGTALEPWYRDLGGPGLGLGILCLSFGLDLVALIGLRARRISGFLLVMIMCYCSVFAFFAPRLTSGPVIAVIVLFCLDRFWSLLRPGRRSFVPPHPAPLPPRGPLMPTVPR